MGRLLETTIRKAKQLTCFSNSRLFYVSCFDFLIVVSFMENQLFSKLALLEQQNEYTDKVRVMCVVIRSKSRLFERMTTQPMSK